MLFLLMLVSVFAEVITIGAVIPFLGVLTAPEQVFHLSWLQPVIQGLDIETAKELLFPLTLAFILIALFSSAIRIVQLWYNSRLTAAIDTGFSRKHAKSGKLIHHPGNLCRDCRSFTVRQLAWCRLPQQNQARDIDLQSGHHFAADRMTRLKDNDARHY
ncbi:MAG: hypothetical protein WGN25_07845 [Candidatus Electrothrix sp. GW3-4]|uniref:hypothetical protein n=1 Tax=Candidatus Electrothrix sp. GW3-4 TaxID=3126740 RepID=UPI0030CC9EA8